MHPIHDAGGWPALLALLALALPAMLVNAGSVNEIFRNLKTNFHRTFDAAGNNWMKVADLIPSTGKYNDYSWISYFPRLREWLGERQVRQLEASNYVVTNRKFESTIGVKRDDIEDDQLGVYGNQARMAGYAAAQFPDELVFGLLAKGFASPCHDGKPFFATDHPVGDSEVANMFQKALSIDTYAAARASLGEAYVRLLNMKDPDGRPLNIMPDTLVVPPQLKAEALVLYSAANFKDEQPNPYKGMFEVVCDTRLTSATAWFLMDCSKPLKPLIYQERRKPEFKQQTNTAGDNVPDSVFLLDEFLFGVDCRAEAAFGHWQLAYGSDGTK